MLKGFLAGGDDRLGHSIVAELQENPFVLATGNIVIADAALLFTGKYEKAGDDLVIGGENAGRLVIPDYFASKKRPNLQSADGAVLTADIIDLLAGANLAQYAQTEGESGRAPIGRVEILSGLATATRNGAQIILQVGDRVFKQDLVETGTNSSCSISFLDGSAFSLSANCRMVLNEMVYSPGGAGNFQLMTLVSGAISFVSGQVAKSGDMKVATPVATMGIRGTEVYAKGENTVDANGETVATLEATSLIHQDGSAPGTVQFFNALTNAFLGEVNTHGTVATFRSVGGSTGTFDTRQASVVEMAAIGALVMQASQAAAMGQQNPLDLQQQPSDPNDGTSPRTGGSNGSSSPPTGIDNDSPSNDGGDDGVVSPFEGTDSNAPIILPGTTTTPIGSGGAPGTIGIMLPPLPPPEPPAPTTNVPVTNFATAEDVGLILTRSSLGVGSGTIESVSDPSHGVVSLQTDGTIVFAPPANYSGEATFKVKLAGVANPVTVKVAIAPVADLPVLNTGSAGFDKGDPVLSLGAWVSDPDSESLTVTITGFPPGTEFVDVQRPTVQVGELVNGAWVISSPADIALLGSGSGQLLMKLPENTTGTLSLSVTATAREGEASAFITRQLNIVLDTTITGIATGVVTEDGSSDDNGTTVETISGQLSVIDRTPSESSFKPVPLPSLVKQYGQFAFDESSGQWSFTLNQTTAQLLKEGETTSEALTVHSLDGTASQVITATIVGVNDAPKFTKLLSFEGDAVTAFADWTIAGSVSQTLEATDGNHAARLVSGSMGATQLESFLGLQSGALALNPASQSGYYANATVGSALSTDVYLTAGQTLSFDWRFATGDYRPYNDFAFIAVSSSVTKLADVFAVGDYGALGWQTFTYTATTSGNHTVGFGVLDTGDSAVPSTLTIDNVVIGSDAAFAFQIAEDATGGTNVGQVLASDVDSDPLYYAITGGDSLFVIDSNTGVISLAPGASLDGSLEDYDLTVEVRDRQDHSGFEDTATVTISVIVPEPAQQAQVADMILL